MTSQIKLETNTNANYTKYFTSLIIRTRSNFRKSFNAKCIVQLWLHCEKVLWNMMHCQCIIRHFNNTTNYNLHSFHTWDRLASHFLIIYFPQKIDMRDYGYIYLRCMCMRTLSAWKLQLANITLAKTWYWGLVLQVRASLKIFLFIVRAFCSVYYVYGQPIAFSRL